MRQVDVHVREVQKEGLVLVVAHEPHAFFHVAFGDPALVGLRLNDVFISQQGQRWVFIVFFLPAHVIAVRNAVIAVESVARGQKCSLIAAVPFADNFGGVSLGFEEFGDGDFTGIESDALTGKEHPAPIERAKANARGIATGEHGPARRRTHRRRHVKVGESHAFFGHFVECRRFVDARPITAEVPIAEVVAVDQNDIGLHICPFAILSAMAFEIFAIYYTLFSQWMQVSANLCFLPLSSKTLCCATCHTSSPASQYQTPGTICEYQGGHCNSTPILFAP